MSEEQPLTAHVDNLVYEPTQIHDQGIDLTVSAIYTVDAPGKLDFGGDELEDAEFEVVPTTQQDPNDDYGWWELDGGQYVLQHNEFLTDVENRLVLQARNELLARGCSHPTVRVSSHLPLLPLSVPEGGVQIKENARVSTLLSPSASDASNGSGERTIDDRSPDE